MELIKLLECVGISWDTASIAVSCIKGLEKVTMQLTEVMMQLSQLLAPYTSAGVTAQSLSLPADIRWRIADGIPLVIARRVT